VCGSLKGKFFHATKENTELKQEIAYLTSHLERTVVTEKLIEDDLSQVEEVQPSSHINCVLVLRGIRIRVRRVFPSLFLAPPTTKRRQQSNPPKLTIHPSQSYPSTLREK
jgi:hypothetical protein